MIRITLDDIDITDKVSNLTKTDVKDDATDTCSFTLKKIKGVIPEVNQVVRVEYDNGSWIKIFEGIITKISQETFARLDFTYEVMCEDYGHILGSKLANIRYENETAGDIVRSLANLYGGGAFTVNGVEDGAEIATIAFERIPVNEAIDRVAKMINYSWYVDYDRDIHFFAKDSEAAPFDLTSSSSNFYWDSLKVVDDSTQVRNRIVVRGGSEISDIERTETFTAPANADERKVFRLANKFDSITSVLINSVAQTVGVKYLNDDDDFDVMWSFNEKFIEITSGTIAEGDILEVTGYPLFPILISQQDGDSIADLANAFHDGVYEHFIKDTDIKSRDEAIQRAQAELEAYANSLREGSFTTTTYGLRSGQIININTHDINEDFIIQQVTFKVLGPDWYVWDVEIASSKTLGIIDILQSLLRKKTFTQNEGEILLSLLQIADEITTSSDSTPTITTTSPPYYIWPIVGSGTDPAAIINLSTVA